MWWGLRVVVFLRVRRAPPEADGFLADGSYDPDTGAPSARHGPLHAVLRGTRAPLLATFHESVEAVQAEFESKGYFYLGSRGVAGPVAALRYHLEEMPEFAFAATLADDRDLAASRAAAVLEDVASPASTAGLPRQAGSFSGALDKSEEHTSELQSLMRLSYAVFCLKKNNPQHITLNLHLSQLYI